MTKSFYFSRIFGASPVTPLQTHIEKVVSCVEELVPYFHAVFKEDWELANQIHSNIEGLENEADNVKNRLRLHLPSSLFMAVDRRDVLELLTLQDKIANRAKDISGLILGRKMCLPQTLHKDYFKFLNRCIDATKQAKVALNELDDLVATGFRGDVNQRVREMIEELHLIEDETDTIQMLIRAKLYTLEKDLSPIDVMFIYEILKWTGDLADHAQSTGNRIQLMLAK